MGEDTAVSPAERLAYLQGLVNALGGIVFEFDWTTGAFTYVSAGAEKLLGFPAADWLVPGFWPKRLHPDDAEWAPKFCREATLDRKDHEFEYRMLRQDGSVVWVREIVTVDAEKGVEGRLRGIMTDITSSKSLEEDLARKVQEFDAVFRVMQDLYFRLDADNRVLDYKAPSLDILYAQPEEFLGKPVTDVLPPSLAALTAENLDLARDTDTMVVTEYELPGPRGQRVWEARFLPLADGEAVVISRDVTEHRDAMLRLAQSQERYQTLVEMSPYAIYVVSLDERVQFCNPAAQKVFGCAKDQTLVGRSITELVPAGHEHDAAVLEGRRIAAEARSRTRGGIEPTHPTRCVRRTIDGQTIDAELSYASIMYKGEPALLVLARDITDELAAERTIRESEARFRSVVEQSPLGMQLYEVQDGKLVLVAANYAADEAVHIKHADLIGLPIERAFPPISRKVPAAFRRIAIEGGAWSMDGFTYPVEGKTKVFDMTAFQISYGRVAVSFQEVTERRAAEEALRKSESQLREAQELAQLGSYEYYITEDRGVSSATLDTILGIGPDFARDSAGWLGLVHPADRDMMVAYIIEEVLGKGLPFDKECRAVRRDTGETIWLHGLGALKNDDFERPTALFGTIQDITERKLAEEAEHRHAERLSAMATELTITEDRERRRLAEELHDRVSQALTVARLHFSSATHDPAGCDTSELAEGIALLDSAIAQTRAITTELAPPMLYELGLSAALQWQCDDFQKLHGLTIHLSADADESGTDVDAKMVLFRAVRELLINIRKHAGTTEAWIDLDTLPDWLVMTVVDHGRGFDPDARDKGSGDSGFGLFSIRERLPHLGGEFELESAPGEGTRVTLRVPRTQG